MDFPAPLLQVQSCPSVCCCPEHSSPSPEPHSPAQPSTATGDVCCTHHLGFSHTTLLDGASDFRLRSVTLGLLSEEGEQQKNGMFPHLREPQELSSLPCDLLSSSLSFPGQLRLTIIICQARQQLHQSPQLSLPVYFSPSN